MLGVGRAAAAAAGRKGDAVAADGSVSAEESTARAQHEHSTGAAGRTGMQVGRAVSCHARGAACISGLVGE